MPQSDDKEKLTGVIWRTLKNGERVPYVRIYIEGRQRLFTPPRPTKTSAKHLYEKLKVDQREGRLCPEQYQLRGGETVQAFINRYLETIHHKRTAVEESCFANWWGQWYQGKTIRSVTHENLEQARAALLTGRWAKKNRRRTPARVNRYTQWLHQVFSHPVNRRHLSFGRNPVDGLKKYEEPEPPILVASLEQERKLAEILERETPGASDWLTLATVCGFRQGEQFKRPKTDVDLERHVIVIPRPKHSRRPKYVPIPKVVGPIIARLMQTPGPWLIHQQAPYPKDPSKPFPVRQWYKTKFRRAVRLAGLPPKFTWHSLRHTWATGMLEAGLDSRVVQQAGGWSTIKMVERYTHLVTERIRQSMDQAAQHRLSTGQDRSEPVT